MNIIRVAIIEDDADIRQLLQLIIDKSPGFSCLIAHESCESGIPEILSQRPDIVLMDIDLPGMSGIEGIRQIRKTNQNLTILMLTIHTESDVIFDCLCAGANGYLVKGIAPTLLLTSIEEAHNGGAPMSPFYRLQSCLIFSSVSKSWTYSKRIGGLKIIDRRWKTTLRLANNYS